MLLCDFEVDNNIFKNSLHHLENGTINGNTSNDHRALDLSLEFNWLNLNNRNDSSNTTNNNHNSTINGNSQSTGNNNSSLFATNINSSAMTIPLMSNAINNNNTNTLLNPLDSNGINGAVGGDAMKKRSQNTTECVPVPSSEHVAEIVGRQGCKIKALRAKTNTYIKTPVRGEEPVFVVTGRKEDVNAAKREILSAAEHFSQIRAQRKNNPGNMGPAPNAHLPGHVTIQVRVPYRVVGLVVGPKGATIKRIQQQTNTYIITPSRDKDPVFEVTGLPDEVENARKEIEVHIRDRTGGIIDSTTGSIGTPEESTSDFSNSPLLSSFDGLNLLTSKSKDYFVSTFLNQTNNTNSALATIGSKNGQTNSTGKAICSLFKKNSFTNSCNSGKNTSNGSYDTDEGIGDSPTFDILASGNFNCNGNNNNNSLWNGDFFDENLNNYLKDSSGSWNHSTGNDNDSNNNTNRRSSSLDSNSLNSGNFSLSSIGEHVPIASAII